MSHGAPREASAISGRYAVERELGRGGMATVFLARDLKHDRPVALKVLRSDVAAALGAERFLREIGFIARLQHPNILPLYDSGENDGALFYVMPCVDGESLRDRLKRVGPLAVGETVRIATGIAEALAYAHEHNVVHRDIKPENILLAGSHALVADFGIARAITRAGGDTLTQIGYTLGTPAYMSPEQASGETELDGRSDLYSLGCVLYEMLSGAPPFTGPNTQSIIARKMRDTPPPLRTVRPEVPEYLAAAVTRALARDPEERFSTARDLVEALGERGGAESGISRHSVPDTIATEETVLLQTGRTRQPLRGGALWLIVLAVVTLLAAAVVVLS